KTLSQLEPANTAKTQLVEAINATAAQLKELQPIIENQWNEPFVNIAKTSEGVAKKIGRYNDLKAAEKDLQNSFSTILNIMLGARSGNLQPIQLPVNLKSYSDIFNVNA